MRKPEITKNTSTPTYPPESVSTPAWNSTTSITAIARRPWMSGRKPDFAAGRACGALAVVPRGAESADGAGTELLVRRGVHQCNEMVTTRGEGVITGPWCVRAASAPNERGSVVPADPRELRYPDRCTRTPEGERYDDCSRHRGRRRHPQTARGDPRPGRLRRDHGGHRRRRPQRARGTGAGAD